MICNIEKGLMKCVLGEIRKKWINAVGWESETKSQSCDFSGNYILSRDESKEWCSEVWGEAKLGLLKELR